MMKRVMILIFSLAVLIGMGLATSAAFAGEGPYGEMRWRWEGWDNYMDYSSDYDDNWAASYLRSRFGYRTHVGDRGWFKMSVENMRVMGRPDDLPGGALLGFLGPIGFKGNIDAQTLSIPTFNDNIYLHEAYFGLSDFLFEGFDAYAGRFSLAYGRERLFGKEDWANFTQYHFDGFKGHYTMEAGWFDLLCLKIIETENLRHMTQLIDHAYGDFDSRGIYFHYNASEDLFFEPYLFYNTMARGTYKNDFFGMPLDEEDWIEIDNDSYFIVGALFDYQTEAGVHLYGEAIMTSGTWHEVVETDPGEFEQMDMDQSTMAFYGGIFYEVDSEQAPFFGFEYNYASGTKDDDKEMKTFMSPFGSHSEYMGRMNLVGWANTSSMRFTGGISPTPGLDLHLDYWIFKLATEEDSWYSPASGIGGMLGGYAKQDDDASKDIGTEIDFFVNYMIEEGIEVEGGFGMFSFGDGPDPDGELDSIKFAWLGTKLSFH